MKRRSIAGLALLAAAVGFAAFYGPGALAGYRFQWGFDSFAKGQQADAGDWPRIEETCNFCHGNRGQSRNAQYPAIAGQPEGYLKAQLQAFASGERSDPQMGPLAASLGEARIESLARYYSGQTPARTDVAAADDRLEAAGKTIVEGRSCAACHGESLSGSPMAPRIAGQGESYLLGQLSAFAQDRRTDPSGAMNELAKSLTRDEVRAVSHYVARLEPVPPTAD